MSTRGTILLAIGMLILGLAIGGLAGGVTGYFMGQSTQTVAGKNLPMMTQPNQPVPPSSQQPQATPPSPTNRRGFPSITNVLGAARVEEVEKDSPAEKAGLKVGDIITAVDSTKLDADHLLGDLIAARKPGNKVELSITRGTQTLIITAELGASAQDNTKAFLGIKYSTIPGGRLPVR